MSSQRWFISTHRDYHWTCNWCGHIGESCPTGKIRSVRMSEHKKVCPGPGSNAGNSFGME